MHEQIEAVIRRYLAEPFEYEAQQSWNEADDSRWVVFVRCCGAQYVLKLASNGFTTPERVSGWTEIIAAYREQGCCSPALLPSRHGRYAETVRIDGRDYVAWMEEYAAWPLHSELAPAVYTRPDGKFVYHDEVFAFYARVAAQRYDFFPYPSGWVRLQPFSSDESSDEVSDCVHSFDALVREKAPQFLPRWERIHALFEANRAQLAVIYDQLPTSVFQGDPFSTNLLLDRSGHFRGLIDYNLAGRDTALNMFLSMVLFGYSYQRVRIDDPALLPELNPVTQASVEVILLDTLRFVRQYYPFSEVEVRAAPLLYKYISCIEYAQLDALEQYAADEAKLTLLFDHMERQLLQDDIDFRGAMMG